MIVTIAIVYSNFKISLLRWLPRTPALLLLLPGLKLLLKSSGEATKVIQNHSSYIVSLSLQISRPRWFKITHHVLIHYLAKIF